jgi:hypothetical protein
VATVLDRLEQLVREVVAALRENSKLLGRVESVLSRLESILTSLAAEKTRANDIAAEDTQSNVTRTAVWRDAARVMLSGLRTPTATVLATALANLWLAWFAHWLGMPLPFLPAEDVHVSPSNVTAPNPIPPVSAGG